MGPVKRNIGYAYVDDGLALFCWGATLALALWAASDRGRRSWGWVVLAGVLAGAAAGSKYFGGVFAVLAGAYILLWRRDARSSVIYGATVLATGTWWYVRSFLLSGDPMHPAGGNVFGHFLWNAADLARQSEEQAGFGTPRNPLYIVAALKEAGVVVWLLAIASLVVRKPPPGLRVLQVVFVAYLAFWFAVTQVPRYLAPVYGAGCLLTCYTLYRVFLRLPASITQSVRRRANLAACVLAALLVVYAADRFSRYQAETAGQQAILAREPGYQLFTAASALIPQLGDRVVQIGFENAIYFFDGTVIGDWFGPGRYSGMLDCNEDACTLPDAQAMARYVHKAGSRMLIVSTVSHPEFDVQAYRRDFEVKLHSHDGFLLMLKSDAAFDR
jgi:4-amino-4-deoxy-L-arabinose transferase-like glycosyltransferase